MRHDSLENRASLVDVVLTTLAFLSIVREFLMPVFWAVVVAVLSLLPAIGAALVWVPAAAILFATGSGSISKQNDYMHLQWIRIPC